MDTRRRRTKSGQAPPDETVRWVDDDTLFDDVSDSEDSTYVSEASDTEEEEDTKVHGITVPSNLPVSVKIHLHARVDSEDEEDYEDEEDEEEEEFISELLRQHLGTSRSSKTTESIPPIKLFRNEQDYFDTLTKKQKKDWICKMKNISKILGELQTPLKFQALQLNTTPSIQAEIIRKIDTMNRMGRDSGEAQKIRTWVDGVLRIPFGKVVPLPVTITDGKEKCAAFLANARKELDNATFGMIPAKMQIMQTLAQWVTNPKAIGNCIAMKGPPGVGKTAFARNGIAKVLNRPFMFFSLGGATDISHYTGHSYTYEGSTWGRILDSVIQAGCMNPVLYFDELDKISGTLHGEEITSMLIHLTDRSQNSHFHDRYFAGIDFDLSQCLFVFSYNDESKVHPVLKDRLTTIHCSGYSQNEKKIIIANYVWPELLKHAGITREELSATEEAAEYIIQEYSAGEEGMRNLIRVTETVVSRINLIRISDEENAKKYKFYIPVEFPMKLTSAMVKTLLTDFAPKIPEDWRSMYL